LITQKGNCKVAILLIFSILLPSALFAQEQLTFVAERDTVAHHGETEAQTELTIRAGEHVTTNWVGYGSIHRTSGFHLLLLFGELGNRHFTFAKHFRPLETEDVFGEDIFVYFPIEHSGDGTRQATGEPIVIGDVDAMWVPYYYRDILLGQDRYRLLEILPGLSRLSTSIAGEMLLWHESTWSDIQNGRAMFYNSVIRLGLGTHLAVRNIRKMDFGYTVDSVISIRDQHERWSWVFLYGSEFWNAYDPGDAVILFLHIDGDYLDIFTYGSDIHVGTFIRVGREFITQYQSLIRTNTADLTNVVWPQRAEGNTGIPPIFVLPDGFRQEIIEYNTENNIEDNIENNAEHMGEIVYQESVFVQQNAETSSMPLWVLIAVIGGVVVIVCVAMLATRRKNYKLKWG